MNKKNLKAILIIVFFLVMNVRTVEAISNNDIQLSDAYEDDLEDENTLYYKYLHSENKDEFVNDIKRFLIDDLNNKEDSQYMNYVLNPYVYIKYKVIAYTNESAVEEGLPGLTNKGAPKVETKWSNDNTKVFENKEWRYLGYNYYENKLITNDFFPMDSKTVSNPYDRTYVASNSAEESWKNIPKNIMYYALCTPAYDDDTHQSYIIADLIYGKGRGVDIAIQQIFGEEGARLLDIKLKNTQHLMSLPSKYFRSKTYRDPMELPPLESIKNFQEKITGRAIEHSWSRPDNYYELSENQNSFVDKGNLTLRPYFKETYLYTLEDVSAIKNPSTKRNWYVKKDGEWVLLEKDKNNPNLSFYPVEKYHYELEFKFEYITPLEKIDLSNDLIEVHAETYGFNPFVITL